MHSWTLQSSASGGQAFETGQGRWYWAKLDALNAGHRLGGFLLDYRESFQYRIGGVQLAPQLSLASGLITLNPMVTAARWTADSVGESFAVFGGALQLSRRVGDVVLRASGEAHAAGDNGYMSGTYYAAGADVYTLVGNTSLGAGVLLGRNPLAEETGFNAWVSHPVTEQLRIDALVSRPLTDPVFGTPGTLGLSVSASWRLLHRTYRPPPPPALVGARASSGRTVQFRVQLASATSVAVSGTFSDWQPIALRRAGDVWTADVVVEPGTHQYGFLVNGEEWYLPPDVVEVIDDGFGRKNATLVVEPR